MSNDEGWDCGRAKNDSETGQRDKFENYLGVKLVKVDALKIRN